MTYAVEIVIPMEIGFPTLRTSSFTPSNNDGLLEKSLDLIEEQRENAMVQLAYYQHKLKQGYDSSVLMINSWANCHLQFLESTVKWKII